MKLLHGLEHTENPPRGPQKAQSNGRVSAVSVSADAKLASVFSQPVALATGC